MSSSNISFGEISNAPQCEINIFRTRLVHAAGDFESKTGIRDFQIVVNGQRNKEQRDISGQAAEKNQEFEFEVRKPSNGFEQLFYAEKVKKEMLGAASIIKNEELIFDRWGLRKLRNSPRSILLLSGPPGTGKTAAAEALAMHLGKPIVSASYPDLESKYLGEGPKRIASFFESVRQKDALGFIDEADTMLGKRMEVTQGSERAANAMTSQLLIELEKHRGLIVFATNLLRNIDRAFRNRVIKVEVPLPDFDTRKKIWQKHFEILSEFPFRDCNLNDLASIEGISGRTICNSFFIAAGMAAESQKDHVTGSDLIDAVLAEYTDDGNETVELGSASVETLKQKVNQATDGEVCSTR